METAKKLLHGSPKIWSLATGLLRSACATIFAPTGANMFRHNSAAK